MELWATVSSNWFELLQTVGIIAGLLFPTLSLVEERRARKATNAFEMVDHHRELWLHLLSEPKLQRIISPAVNLAVEPVTNEEELFVGFALSHLNTCLAASAAKVLTLPEQLDADIRHFFSLPIPHAVYERRKPFLDRELVRIIEVELAKIPDRTPSKV